MAIRPAQIAALLCVAFFAPRVFADECVLASVATPSSPCVAMTRDGRPGAWLGIPLLDELTKARLALPHALSALTAAGELAEVRRQQAEAYRLSGETWRAATAQAQADAAALRKDNDGLRAWYRSPAFVAGATLVATLIVGGFVVYEVKK